jgi:hypothetical protein
MKVINLFTVFSLKYLLKKKIKFISWVISVQNIFKIAGSNRGGRTLFSLQQKLPVFFLKKN